MSSTDRTKFYVDTLADLPAVDTHWVILEFSTVYTPGDERSHTNPGHGYPESYDPVVRYIAYTREDEWKAEVTKRTINGDKKFAALVVKQASVKVDVKVEVSFG